MIATAYEKQRRVESAITAFTEVKNRYPTNPASAEALVHLATLVQQTKDPNRNKTAVDYLTQVATNFANTAFGPRALTQRANIEERENMKVTDPTLGKTVPAALVSYRQLVERYPTAASSEARLLEARHLLRGPEAVRPRGGRPVAAWHALPGNALRRVVGGRRAVRQEGQGQGEGCRGVRQGPLLLEALQGRTEEGAVVRAGILPGSQATWHICSVSTSAPAARARSSSTSAAASSPRRRASTCRSRRLRPAGPSRTRATGGARRSEAVRAVLASAGRSAADVDRGDRLLRPDARLDAARRAKARSCARRCSGAISGPTRSAARSPRRIGARATDRADAEPGAHRLHAAQAAVGPRARARRSGHASRSVLLPKDYVRLPADRRQGDRRRRRVGHAAASTSRSARWSDDDAATSWTSTPSLLPRGVRVARGHGHASRAEGADGDRPAGRHARRRRRRRSGGRRRRHGHRAAGRRERHDRHVRRRLRRHRSAGARSRRPRPHVLSRRPRTLARHGRHAGRGPVAALVPRSVRRGRRRRARSLRSADGGSRARAGRLATACCGRRT